MSLTYAQLQSTLATFSNIPSVNAGMVIALPQLIDQAEGKIYREPEFYFLSTTVTDDTGSTTPDDQVFVLPRVFTVLQSINRVSGNERPPLTKTTREAINAFYPRRLSNSPADVPTKWAMLTDISVLLGPTPGGAVQLECIGTARPANISASSPGGTTWLWSTYGDLAFASLMMAVSGYMRNYGAQADDPKMAISWGDEYERLKAGVSTEEMRRKFEGSFNA